MTTRPVDDSVPPRLLNLAVHELLHALNWQGPWSTMGTDAEDSRPTLSGAVLLQRSREYFGCPTLSQIRLGATSFMLHASQRIPCHQSIQPLLYPSYDLARPALFTQTDAAATPTDSNGAHWDYLPWAAHVSIIGPSGGSNIDPLTLAAMEDTGWYSAAWENAVSYLQKQQPSFTRARPHCYSSAL